MAVISREVRDAVRGNAVTGAEPNPVARFFGFVLFTVGVLMATLCGLCTVAFLVMSAVSPGGDGGMAAMSIFIGGIPTGIGVLLMLAGRSLLRSRRSVLPTPPPASPPPTPSGAEPDE